jgi:myo-inositol 2-dehydrogenase/D-chiro-inositol 1-dehydrogenase
MEKIVFGVIGAGRIGKIHAANLVKNIPGAKVKLVSELEDHIDDTLRDWATDLGVELTSSTDDIFNDPEIKAVAICSSTDTHAEMIIHAAQAGKDIFCEKPIDYDIGRIKEALAAVDEAGVKFMVGFNRRFDHNFKRVREAIESGEIGTPHIVKITSRDPGPPPIEYIKVSGGLLFDMMIHDFDMSLFQMGDDEVEEVFAKGAVLIDPAIGEAGDIDTAVVILKFKSGAMAIIDDSRKAVYGYDQRVEAFGSGGAIMVSNDLPNTSVVFSDKNTYHEKMLHFFLERYQGAYIDELKAFVECLVENKAPPMGAQAGLKAVRVAVAAKRSLEENRPVQMFEIEA